MAGIGAGDPGVYGPGMYGPGMYGPGMYAPGVYAPGGKLPGGPWGKPAGCPMRRTSPSRIAWIGIGYVNWTPALSDSLAAK